MLHSRSDPSLHRHPRCRHCHCLLQRRSIWPYRNPCINPCQRSDCSKTKQWTRCYHRPHKLGIGDGMGCVQFHDGGGGRQKCQSTPADATKVVAACQSGIVKKVLLVMHPSCENGAMRMRVRTRNLLGLRISSRRV